MNASIFKVLINFCNAKPVNWLLLRLTRTRVSRYLIPKYIKIYKINTQEIRDELKDFDSLNAFFIRFLRSGSRPIDMQKQSIVSPVDCRLELSQTITEDAKFTVKGQVLSLTELLGEENLASDFCQGHIFVLYLSPADYHRIHAPFDSSVLRHYALGKKSWPVNREGMRYGPRPLCTNYRIINLLANNSAAVFVGATNVNSIVSVSANDWQKGAEVAYFQFGSTVVLLFKEGQITPCIPEGSRLLMGETLAVFTSAEALKENSLITAMDEACV